MIVELAKFSDYIDELHELTRINWEDTVFPDAKESLDLDFDLYLGLEEVGKLVFFAVKDNNKLIGYYAGLKSPNIQSKSSIYLTQLMLVIHPDYRGHGGITLIDKAVKDYARENGVHRVINSARTHTKLGKLWERKGYVPIEQLYSWQVV